MAPSLKCLDRLMRIIVIFAPIIAMTAAQASSPSSPSCSNGQFTSSCAFPGLKFVDHALGMYCLNDNTNVFGYNWTWIDLNMCLTNEDGKLVPTHNGSYSSSCSNCQVSFNLSVHLTCECYNTAGTNKSQAAIDLNSLIYNVDGAMGCCEHMGNKTWKGPQAQ